MKQIIFIVTAVAAVLILAFIFTPESVKNSFLKKVYLSVAGTEGNYKTIPLNEVKEMLDKKEAVLLDVRNPDELEKEGYVPGSINIPLGELDSRIGELDKNKTYITFCAVGGRSAKAAATLSKKGFTKIYNAKEGMRTWPYEKAK